MVRVLQVTSHSVTVKKLLLPLIDRLTEEGYDVTSACGPGGFADELSEQGYSIRPIDMERRLDLKTNTRTLRQLYRLMRQERFDIVHVHTPVAAALGRIAAWTARVPIIIYTAHGFYHHENMSPSKRKACVLAEKLLGRTTEMLFTQSQEDADSAIKEGINRTDRVVWIGNGVDIPMFASCQSSPLAKESYGIPPDAPVIGFLGPLVAEKGVVELVEAFQLASAGAPGLHLLMAGDVLNGDRDQQTKTIIRQKVADSGLAPRLTFPGYQDDIQRFFSAIDIFALPSHREGMPRSIIEAMASGKPVIASNIRGCREEVVHEETGLICPLGDSRSLAEAMLRIAGDSGLCHRMGQAGLSRARELFEEDRVLDRQVQVYRQLVEKHLPSKTDEKARVARTDEIEAHAQGN